MRRILVESARRKSRQKRGGGLERIPIDDLDVATRTDDVSVLRVDEVLEELELKDPICASLVKLRFFAGLTVKQAADALGISSSTADTDWAYARAWLRIAMGLDE